MARCKEVTVTTRLGRQTIKMDKVITFPRGLMGFENRHEFTLLQIRQGSPFLLLQSMEDPGLGLLVTDPYCFLDNYPIKIGDAEQHLLRIRTIRQVAVLVTVSIPPGKPELTTLNLTGPVLINHELRVGLQVPQSNTDTPPQVYIHRKEAEHSLVKAGKETGDKEGQEA